MAAHERAAKTDFELACEVEVGRLLAALSAAVPEGSRILEIGTGVGVGLAWRPLSPLLLSIVLHHTQGASVSDGAIWISTSDAGNDLYRVSLSNGSVALMSELGPPGGEGEGIDVTSIQSISIHAMVRMSDQLFVENLGLVRTQ